MAFLFSTKQVNIRDPKARCSCFSFFLRGCIPDTGTTFIRVRDENFSYTALEFREVHLLSLTGHEVV